MLSSLTQNVPPQKIRYHHIVHDLEIFFEQNDQEGLTDFRSIHSFFAQYYGLSKEELLLRGMRRAYRQIVEGI